MKIKHTVMAARENEGVQAFDGIWTPAEGTPPLSYFAASNSGRGFVSYFDEIFRERCDARLIIKGGPGTGKSRMLFELGSFAEGLGARVEYYYCSSDPDSLDGIVARLPDGVTVGAQDGTAPHSEEASLPGARDNIFDLGVFWDSARLQGLKGEIEELNAKKNRAWRQAYRCLDAAGQLKAAALDMARSVIDTERLQKAAARAAADARRRAAQTEVVSVLPPPPEKSCRAALRTPHLSLGMKGTASLRGFYHGARDVFLLSDELLPGAGELFVTAVADHAQGAGTRCRLSPDPLSPELTVAFACGESVFTSEKGGAIPADADCHRVGMRRFIDPSALRGVREEYSRLMALSNRAVTQALLAMSSAGREHFALEEIYSSAMDFNAKEQAVHRLCEDFFARIM